MFCMNCGGENAENYKFCRHCGQARVQNGAGTPETVAIPPDSSQEEPVPPAQTPDKSDQIGLPPPLIGGQPSQTTSSSDSWKSNKKLWVGVIAAISLAVVILIAAFFIFGSSGSRVMLVGYPDRSNEVDLYLLKPGQTQNEGTLIIEEVTEGNGSFFAWTSSDSLESVGNYFYKFGGFVPEADDLLIWYLNEDNELNVGQMSTGDDELTPIYDTNDRSSHGYFFEKGRTLVVIEPRNNTERCYVSFKGKAAERVVKGDDCTVTRDGSTILASEQNTDGFSLIAVDIDGKNETQLLDEEKDVDSFIASFDGSQVLYREDDSGEAQIFLIDRKTGDTITKGKELVRVSRYGFASRDNTAYYFGENDDEELELFTLIDGVSNSIATGYSMNAVLTPDGKHLVYLVGEDDGEKTLFVRALPGGEETKIIQGDYVSFAVLDTLERILIREQGDGELTISSVGFDGRDPIQLYSEDDMVLSSSHYIQGKNKLHFVLSDEDNMEYLFVTSADQADGFMLVDEWADINMLNQSENGKQLVMVGTEDHGDDPVLYVLSIEEGAQMIELDDNADHFVNTVFSRNNADVIYTVITGSDPDDVEIRKIRARDGESYETLNDEAFLVDAGWAALNPYTGIYWFSEEY